MSVCHMCFRNLNLNFGSIIAETETEKFRFELRFLDIFSHNYCSLYSYIDSYEMNKCKIAF